MNHISKTYSNFQHFTNHINTTKSLLKLKASLLILIYKIFFFPALCANAFETRCSFFCKTPSLQLPMQFSLMMTAISVTLFVFYCRKNDFIIGATDENGWKMLEKWKMLFSGCWFCYVREYRKLFPMQRQSCFVTLLVFCLFYGESSFGFRRFVFYCKKQI